MRIEEHAAVALSPTVPTASTDAVAPTLCWPGDERLATSLRLSLRLLAVALCGLHAYANRHLINPDGLSYLDMATGDGSPNGYWSPLYPWLLGAVFRLVQPTAYWECALAHAVNFGLFMVSLAAFEWLLREVLRTARSARSALAWETPLPDWVVVGMGYALFVYTARRLISVSLVTPDMLVASAVYAACAVLLRMRRLSGWLNPLALGMILGLGFLAKAVMFLLAGVFLVVCVFCGPWRSAWKRLGIAALGFTLLAVLVVVPLSLARGRLTYGESGRLNYLWYVLQVPRPERLAAVDEPGNGGPTPRVAALPKDSGTYSLWYDPSRYFDRFRPYIDVRGQIAASSGVASYYFGLLTVKMLPFTVALIGILGWSFFVRDLPLMAWLRGLISSLGGQFCLLLPALAGLAVYLLVGHAEARLVGMFFVVLALAQLAAARIPRRREAACRPVAAVLISMLLLFLGGNLVFDLGKAVFAAWAGENSAAHPHARVAEALARQGVVSGEAVGSIGFTYNAYWARLAGVSIGAEIPECQSARFWRTSPEQQEQVLREFARQGIRVVVCDYLPVEVAGWQRVDGTSFAYRLVDR